MGRTFFEKQKRPRANLGLFVSLQELKMSFFDREKFFFTIPGDIKTHETQSFEGAVRSFTTVTGGNTRKPKLLASIVRNELEGIVVLVVKDLIGFTARQAYVGVVINLCKYIVCRIDHFVLDVTLKLRQGVGRSKVENFTNSLIPENGGNSGHESPSLKVISKILYHKNKKSQHNVRAKKVKK
ncbi:MAG: hypothetical protein J6C46_11095 [Clostridia bacterium]|nr:hypothetical protein [Clostridia bacterium]